MTLRYAQQLCDQDRYCVAGLAYFCGRLYCYPKPSMVTIREARVGETYNGINFYNMKRPGLSVGDVIEVQFDENSTMPVVNTTAAVLRILNFSVPLGRDGTQFVGRWVNPSLLYVTIVAGGWDSGQATDPTLTRAGNLTFTVTPEANLRCVCVRGCVAQGVGCRWPPNEMFVCACGCDARGVVLIPNWGYVLVLRRPQTICLCIRLSSPTCPKKSAVAACGVAGVSTSPHDPPSFRFRSM